MSPLEISDVYEPYYEGRKTFVRKDERAARRTLPKKSSSVAIDQKVGGSDSDGAAEPRFSTHKA